MVGMKKFQIQITGTTVKPNEVLGTTQSTTNTTEVPTTPVNNTNRVKWAHSKTPLNEVQERALAHGPNFAIATKEPPVNEYISQIEKVCQQLKQGKAEELRGEIKQIFKKIQLSKPNITKEEAKAIQELKRDKERVILTADRGVSMVVMDQEEYIQKSEELLHQPTYKELPSDPTTKHKNRLISILKTIKSEGGIEHTTYKRLYPHMGRISQILWPAQNT